MDQAQIISDFISSILSSDDIRVSDSLYFLIDSENTNPDPKNRKRINEIHHKAVELQYLKMTFDQDDNQRMNLYQQKQILRWLADELHKLERDDPTS